MLLTEPSLHLTEALENDSKIKQLCALLGLLGNLEGYFQRPRPCTEFPSPPLALESARMWVGGMDRVNNTLHQCYLVDFRISCKRVVK